MTQQTSIPATAEVREVFEQVLSEPEFHYVGTSPLVSAVQAVTRWIRDLLNRLFPNLGEAEIRIVSWVLLGVCVLFTIHLLLRWFRDGKIPGRRHRAPDTAALTRPRDAAEWREWARSSAGAGRLRDAATGIYQATILTLDERGALRYREWKTPGDYALEVSGQEALRAPFLDFLGHFVEVAFGPVEPTREAYEALSAGAARFGGAP